MSACLVGSEMCIRDRQSCVGHQIVTLPPKAQLASLPLLLLSLLSCTERPPDRHGVIQSSVGLHRHCYSYRCCHLQSRVGHPIATVPPIAQLASSPPLSLSLFSSTEPHGTSDRSGLVQSPEGLHCRCSYHVQSRVGHQIATVPSIVHLTFIAQ